MFGLIPLTVCAAMAAFVLATRPNRRQNRLLSTLLLIEGVITFGGPAGACFANTDEAAATFFATHFVGLFLLLPTMTNFLATIDTPFARPLATRPGVVLPWLAAIAAAVAFVVRPQLFIRDLRGSSWGSTMFDPGPLASVTYAVVGVALTYSLVVAVSSYRRAAPGTVARERARWYAIAFGFNDGLTIVVTTLVPLLYVTTHGTDLRPIEFMFVWAIPIVESIFVALMAYGILYAQLFDIDLRLAAGLRRGAIAATVLFTFFVAAELAERLVSEEFGYVIGAVVAAALIFVHKPIEHLAGRFSRAMLPGVEASPAYIAYRKLEVYVEALEAAYEDGQLSIDDRAILKRLQTKLGIAPVDAARLEEDVRSARFATGVTTSLSHAESPQA